MAKTFGAPLSEVRAPGFTSKIIKAEDYFIISFRGVILFAPQQKIEEILLIAYLKRGILDKQLVWMV